MTLGNHSFDKGGSLLPRYVKGQPCDKTDRVRVWSLERSTHAEFAFAIPWYLGCIKAQSAIKS